MPPGLVFSGFNRCYQLLREEQRTISFAHQTVRNASLPHMRSKVYGIIRSVKKLFISLAIAVSLLIATSVVKAHMQNLLGSQPPAPDKSLISQGKTRYADYKCGDCHGANGEGGPDGPALTTTYIDAGQISRFLERPSPDAYMKGMPNIPAAHPDNKALVAYVVSLKQPSTPETHPNQPPPPSIEEPAKKDSPVSRKLSAAEKAHVLDGDFTIEKNVAHLPDNLKSAFAKLAKEPDFKMANPGEKFEATDVATEPGLPDRRLIFAGTSKNRYFIHYEHGGWGYHCDLVVFDLNPEGKVSFLWGGAGFQTANDLQQLRKKVSDGVFADDRAYAW